MTMPNAHIYLSFKRKMGQLTDTEKMFVMNRIFYELTVDNLPESRLGLNARLVELFRCSVAEQNKVEWWWALRDVSAASMYHKLRLV